MKLHILAIAAHPDDIELSCSGTLIKHARMGQAVGILDLTEGELGTRGNVDLRREEASKAAEVMGVKVRMNASMPDGFFRNDELHQRKLITYIRYFKPEIVLANTLEDRHPDHARGGRLIADACFYAGLQKITTEWNGKTQEAWRPKRVFHYLQDRILEPDFVVDVSEVYEVKLQAIKCYKSQFHDPESQEPATYISSKNFLDFLKYRDATLGKRIGTNYGEGFITKNIPGVSNLNDLLLPEVP